jgi:hypothetical protein
MASLRRFLTVSMGTGYVGSTSVWKETSWFAVRVEPFADSLGRLAGVSANGRGEILLELLGGRVPVSLDLFAVVAM